MFVTIQSFGITIQHFLKKTNAYREYIVGTPLYFILILKGDVYMNTVIPKMRTIKETAKETGLAYNYIRNLCLQNKIVYVKAGNKYLVNIDKLIDYLNTGSTA